MSLLWVVSIEKINVWIGHWNFFDNIFGAISAIIDADVEIREPLKNVMMNELRDIGFFIGRNTYNVAG